VDFHRRYVKKTKDTNKDRNINNSAGNRSGKVEKVERSNVKGCIVMFVVNRETEAAFD
jgi:hypothetical protein